MASETSRRAQRGAPRRSRAGLPSLSLTEGLHRPCPCTRLSREALGPCSPCHAGVRQGDRTLPAWGEVTWSALPEGAGHSRACRHPPPWAQRTGQPRSPGKQPCSQAVCAPTRPTNPPEMGLEDPLGRCPPGLGLSPGSPRHLSWSWGAGVGGWSIGGENTIARCGGILFGFCLLTLRSAVLRLRARWLFYLRTWSQGPRRPGQPRNKPLVLVTNGRADD